MLKKIIPTVLAAALAVSLAACGGTTTTTTSEETVAPEATAQVVTIGYLPITHALAVFEEKELLAQENSGLTIELQKFSSWSDLTDALNAGRIDGASVLIELAMSAASQGIDLKAVALGHRDGNVLIASPEIDTLADLAGKTIAIPHTQSSHNILVQDALAEAGLTVDDINVVQLAPTEMPSALASGSIDGYCVAEPFGAQAVALGVGHVLSTSEALWEDSLCCGLVIHNDAIDRLGDDAVNALIETYYEAGAALDAGAAAEVASEYLGQDADVLATSLEWIHYDDLEITEEAYQTLVDKVIEYGINDAPPSYADFVYHPAD